MNRRIYKYVLNNGKMMLPAGYEILSIQAQDGHRHLVLWAIVDPSAPHMHEIDVYIVGTGWEIPDHLSSRDHVASVQIYDLVWHVFVKGYSDDQS